MEFKNLFRPNFSKITLALAIFFLAIAFPTYGEICPVCAACPPGQVNCCQCHYGLKFFSGFYFIDGIIGKSFYNSFGHYAIFILDIASTFLLSYALSCIINRHKK